VISENDSAPRSGGSKLIPPDITITVSIHASHSGNNVAHPLQIRTGANRGKEDSGDGLFDDRHNSAGPCSVRVGVRLS